MSPSFVDRSVESFGDLAKSAFELAVFACPADVIENRQQRRQRVTDGEVAYGFAVTFDALAVVGVLGLHPLEIGGSLGQLGAQLRQLDRVDPSAAPGWAPRRGPTRSLPFGGAPSGRRVVR